jgi:excisionase family DNA binding protein
MSCPAFQDAESVMPKEHDITLAMRSSKELASLLPRNHQDFRLFVREKQKEVELTLPFSAVKMLLHILTQMSEGNAVTIIPIHAELSTQEAANLLNVSRPFLVQLLEKGKIPFHKVGSHRRVYFKDLQAFKTQVDSTSNQALKDLSEQAQKLDMGY